MVSQKTPYFLVLLIVFLWGCTTNNNPANFSYLRSPQLFIADTAIADHLFCLEKQAVFNDDSASCHKAKKYRLYWERPEDTVGFLGYRIFVDTASPGAPQLRWNKLQGHAELASIIVTSRSEKDSLIFVIGTPKAMPDTLNAGNTRIFQLDTLNRVDPATGNIYFALVPVYSGDGTPGQPNIESFITTDKFPPNPFLMTFEPKAKEVDLKWPRPNDPTSFFNKALDTGVIKEYRLKVTLAGRLTPDRNLAFNPVIEYWIGGEKYTAEIVDSLLDKKDTYGWMYILPDGNRAKKTATGPADSLVAHVVNLTPQDKLNFRLFAVDSAGNSNEVAMQIIEVQLTDTTQPSPPKLSVDSTLIGRNSVVIAWTASRDTVADGNGKLIEGESPNLNIREYAITRILQRAAGEKGSALDRFDTVITLDSIKRKQTAFLDTMKYLPPGRQFFLRIKAVDSSGFASRADSLIVETQSIQFAAEDSGLQCPNGFLPITRGHFILGDSSASAQTDEKPWVTVKNAPYCIEPYEHRDSSGRFVNSVSWIQADSICRGMPIDTSYHPQLCSEVEWERACEGPDIGADSALVHGIQSERHDPTVLQNSCNQGTNDSMMAKSFDLRNGICLTKEGVFDMAGNYSEWVRDPYSDHAYQNLKEGDSVSHEFSFSDSGASLRRGFRGGNFLAPANVSLSAIQNLARCSNRDYAQQVRPNFRLDCEDSVPMVAVIYPPGPVGFKCIPLNDALKGKNITDIRTNPQDTANVSVYVEGSAHPTLLAIPPDSAFAGKRPLSAALTPRSLAIVTFEKPGMVPIPDTLDATEMKDTSQTTLKKIFTREAGNSGYTVHQEAGVYAIQYRYAYASIGTKPAKPYYNNRAISFRCCSLAKAPAQTPIASSP